MNPGLAESNLAFVKVGTSGRIDVAGSSATRTETNDLTVDLAGYFYHSGATDSNFGTPQFFPSANGDTFFNTVGNSGDTLVTANDTRGVDNSCQSHGSDIAIFDVAGNDPSNLSVSRRELHDQLRHPRRRPRRPRTAARGRAAASPGSGRPSTSRSPARSTACDKDESNGLQPSFNASIMKSTDDGVTWTNPWGKTSADGAAPPYSRSLGRYRAMWPGQSFAAPFFVQYGPGNTGTVDGGDKYLYAVSTDGYAYNGNYLHLARVPLNAANGNADIQNAKAWQFYHGPVGGSGTTGWTSSPAGATRVLQARHRLSQPAIQYVPSLHEYVLVTFYYGQAHSDFPALHRESVYAPGVLHLAQAVGPVDERVRPQHAAQPVVHHVQCLPADLPTRRAAADGRDGQRLAGLLRPGDRAEVRLHQGDEPADVVRQRRLDAQVPVQRRESLCPARHPVRPERVAGAVS